MHLHDHSAGGRRPFRDFMKQRTLLLLSLGLAALLSGCAAPTTHRTKVDDALIEIEARKQREIAFDTMLSGRQRLTAIAHPLLKAAAPLCGEETHLSLGAVFTNKYLFAEEFRDIAVVKLGVGEPLQILQVIGGSAAQRAGLMAGDIIVSLNGQSVPTGEDALKRFADILEESLKEGAPARIRVVRGDDRLSFQATPERICSYAVMLGPGDEVNAYADGQRIVIAGGMLRFARSDNELALVVAHELAHNAMGHIKAKMQNYMLGSLLDILAAAAGVNTQGVFGNMAAQAYSQEFEAEADYVGLYIMARAGLETAGAANFWRRMAAIHPGSIGRNHAATHPATAERFLAIEKTVAEIENKKAAGLPLEPRYKADKKPGGDGP